MKLLIDARKAQIGRVHPLANSKVWSPSGVIDIGDLSGFFLPRNVTLEFGNPELKFRNVRGPLSDSVDCPQASMPTSLHQVHFRVPFHCTRNIFQKFLWKLRVSVFGFRFHAARSQNLSRFRSESAKLWMLDTFISRPI